SGKRQGIYRKESANGHFSPGEQKAAAAISRFSLQVAQQEIYGGVGRAWGVGRGLGVALGVAVAVAVGVAVGVGVALGVGVGEGPPSAQYLPPVLKYTCCSKLNPPQAMISLPVHTAL